MVCAKELNIPQISEYMKHMGITDEELEQLSDQMMDMMDGDSFEMGGSGTLPPFLQNMMKNMPNMPLFSDDNQNEEEETLPSEDLTAEPPKPSKKEKRKKKKDLKFLNNYCTNLSQKAEEGKMDAIIGRDKEIERVVQILCRRTKNNPCLIGEPGVGKTAIAEGIAIITVLSTLVFSDVNLTPVFFSISISLPLATANTITISKIDIPTNSIFFWIVSNNPCIFSPSC